MLVKKYYYPIIFSHVAHCAVAHSGSSLLLNKYQMQRYIFLGMSVRENQVEFQNTTLLLVDVHILIVCISQNEMARKIYF